MEILKSTIVYECPVLRVEEREVTLDDGRTELRWVVVRQPNISVIGLTNEKKLVLIKEVVGKKQEEVLGFAGGKMKDYDPSPEALLKEALHELQTEAGYAAQSIELVHTGEIPSDYFERSYYLYAAWDLTNVGQQLEQGEDKIQVVLASHEEIKELISLNTVAYKREVEDIQKVVDFFKQKGLL